jgi:hypothetical protein
MNRILLVIGFPVICAVGSCTLRDAGPPEHDTGQAFLTIDRPEANRGGIVRTRLEVEDASDGSCATVSVVGQARSIPAVDTCHGWILAGCDNLIFAHGRGVRTDTAAVLLVDQSNSKDRDVPRDLLPAIQLSVAQNVPENIDILHLEFGQPRCLETGMQVSFTGSVIANEAEGASREVTGEVRIDGEANATVRLLPAGQR